MREIMNKSLSDSVLNQRDEAKRAQIYEGSTQKPFAIQRMTLDLSTARLETDPLKIRFPFKSVYSPSATDTSLSINIKPTSDDSYQSYFPLKQNDSWNSDISVSNASIFWTAQYGKTIDLIFFTDAQFASGSQISVTGGGVSIVDGSSADAMVRVTLSAATSTEILPTDSTRKKSTLQNTSGADLYIGGTSAITNAGATMGLKIPADGFIYWQNTGPLYGYSVAGGDVRYMTER